MTIGEKISTLRKEKGLSQESFAEMLGVSRQSVSKWESGTSIPDIDKVVSMSNLFNVSTDYILKSDDSPVTNFESEIATVQPPVSNYTNTPKKKLSVGKIVAIVLAFCIVATGIGVPAYFGGIREAWWEICGGKVQYEYVLVHGLGGWGESSKMDNISSYWGASTGNLVEHLNSQGYQVNAPTVGPISSTWDRVCELYAQLTGTTVDYGEAHSKEHNHARYGRNYATPLIENWGEIINGGQRVKINLVGHSFGGATVRMLTSLLEYGNQSEQDATGKETSPLFTGGKGNWVHSVTTLCAPHNGSSLTCILEDLGGIAGIDNTTDLLVSLCFKLSGITSPVNLTYDFMLDQFGIGEISGNDDDIENAVNQVTGMGTDHAGFDLSPDGAAKINESIKIVEDVYYFSYSYSTTKEGSLLKGQVPESGTFAVLYPIAIAMGTYTGTTDGGIVIDEKWQKNDGLVNVISAQHPANEEWIDYNQDEVERGIWNVMPVKNGDHGTVIGLDSDIDSTQQFYTDWFSVIDSLKR